MVLIIWLLALITTATVMTSKGYLPSEERPDAPALIWGIPSWVFWGLFVPWFVLIAVTWWFALSYLKDDEPFQEFPDSCRVEPDDELGS